MFTNMLCNVVFLLLHSQKHSIKQHLMNKKWFFTSRKPGEDRSVRLEGYFSTSTANCAVQFEWHHYINWHTALSDLQMSLLTSLRWKEGKGLLGCGSPPDCPLPGSGDFSNTCLQGSQLHFCSFCTPHSLVTISLDDTTSQPISCKKKALL